MLRRAQGKLWRCGKGIDTRRHREDAALLLAASHVKNGKRSGPKTKFRDENNAKLGKKIPKVLTQFLAVIKCTFGEFYGFRLSWACSVMLLLSVKSDVSGRGINHRCKCSLVVYVCGFLSRMDPCQQAQLVILLKTIAHAK